MQKRLAREIHGEPLTDENQHQEKIDD